MNKTGIIQRSPAEIAAILREKQTDLAEWELSVVRATLEDFEIDLKVARDGTSFRVPRVIRGYYYTSSEFITERFFARPTSREEIAKLVSAVTCLFSYGPADDPPLSWQVKALCAEILGDNGEIDEAAIDSDSRDAQELEQIIRSADDLGDETMLKHLIFMLEASESENAFEIATTRIKDPKWAKIRERASERMKAQAKKSQERLVYALKHMP